MALFTPATSVTTNASLVNSPQYRVRGLGHGTGGRRYHYQTMIVA